MNNIDFAEELIFKKLKKIKYFSLKILIDEML